MTLKVSKKKFTASLVLFIITVIVLVLLVFSFIFYGKLGSMFWIMPVSFLAYLILIIVSLLLHGSYRKNCFPDKSSTVLYVFQWIFFAPLIIIAVIIIIAGLMSGAKLSLFGGNAEDKAIKIKNEKGKQYTLKKVYVNEINGKEEFEDQDGDIWVSRDKGQTFERRTKITHDEDGTEYDLTPLSDGSPYYQDQYGDLWQKGAGKTFIRLDD